MRFYFASKVVKCCNFTKVYFTKVHFSKMFYSEANVMTVFIGRKRELAAMERLYQQDGFQMTVMYGRRRVGKSTLLK